MDRTPPGESLPPSQDDIDISRADLETAADAAGHFGCDQARTRTEKRVTRSGLKRTRIASPSFRALRAPGRRTASRSDPITAPWRQPPCIAVTDSTPSPTPSLVTAGHLSAVLFICMVLLWSSSRLTLRWREPDSNHWSRSCERS